MSDQKTSECKSCGAEIRWIKTKNGKNISVDVPDREDGRYDDVLNAEIFDRDWMTTHFETCPNATSHRRQGGDPIPPPTPTPGTEASVNAKRLNTALAVLEDIANNPPDGLRSIELAKTALSQIRGVR